MICHFDHSILISWQWLVYSDYRFYYLMLKAMNFNDVAIVSVKRINWTIHFWCMSKNDAIDIMKSSNLNEKSGSI